MGAWSRPVHATYGIHCVNPRVTVVVNHGGDGRLAAITAREGDASEPIRLEPTFWSMARHRALAIRKRAELERPAFHLGIRGERGVFIFNGRRHFLRCEWDLE